MGSIDIVSMVAGLLDKIIPDPQARSKAKLAMLDLKQKGHLSEIEAKAKIVTAEASSEHWITSVWRPLIMLLFGLILFNNFILAPYVQLIFHLDVSLTPKVDSIPDRLWDLLYLGLGGYIAGRSTEKVVKTAAAAVTKYATARAAKKVDEFLKVGDSE